MSAELEKVREAIARGLKDAWNEDAPNMDTFLAHLADAALAAIEAAGKVIVDRAEYINLKAIKNSYYTKDDVP